MPRNHRWGNYSNKQTNLAVNNSFLPSQVGVSQTTPTCSHAPFQLRPTTPSSIGPTLRQMEHHFLQAELQLEGVEGEMSARFDLTRTKMEATIKESEVKLRDGEVPPQEPPYENVSLLNEATSRPSTRSGRWVWLM